MNRKQLNILVGLVLVVGGLGLILYNKQASSWSAGDSAVGGKLMPDLPINDVAQIAITQGITNLNLFKKEDLWRVQERWDYPANFANIGELLRKLWELETVQSVTVGPSQLGRLELLPPNQGAGSGIRVDLKDKAGKTVRSILLGKKYLRESEDSSPMGGGGYPVGRYVMVESTDSTAKPSVWVISDPLSQAEAKPEGWLNKDFFKVEKVRSVSVTSAESTNSWKVFREKEGGDLILGDVQEGEEFDKSKASGVGYLLSSPSFNDIVAPEKNSAETGMDNPLIAEIETFDNFIYTIKVGRPTDEDNYHMNVSVKADIATERTPAEDEKPEDKERLDKEFNENRDKLIEKLKKEQSIEKWNYLVSKWTIDALLKERKDFFAEKKEATETDSPAAPPNLQFPDVGVPPPLPQ
ncbi:MAG: DUF4340 domain-containing protein [Verrucomicrobia bacterium]|nr:DUF4340 domain-containing protein [Verrucomicrobiota bacterium]